jgi:hypothetical protein
LDEVIMFGAGNQSAFTGLRMRALIFVYLTAGVEEFSKSLLNFDSFFWILFRFSDDFVLGSPAH